MPCPCITNQKFKALARLFSSSLGSITNQFYRKYKLHPLCNHWRSALGLFLKGNLQKLSELGMIHFIQPGGWARREVRVPTAASVDKSELAHFPQPSCEPPESCSGLRSDPPWAGQTLGRPGWRWGAGVWEGPVVSLENAGGCRGCWPGCRGIAPVRGWWHHAPAGRADDLHPDDSEPESFHSDCCKMPLEVT